MTQSENGKVRLPIGFPESGFGDPNAGKKILVAYASAAGSTGGIAETIAKSLSAGGAYVDLRRVSSVPPADAYDAVVVGSAIHGGKWLPEAIQVLAENQQHLRRVPTAFFLVGLMVNKQDPSARQLVNQFLAAERELVKPVAEGRFVGALFPRQYPGAAGFGMRFFTAYCGLGLRGGDFRDPAAIRAWAENVRPLLLP